MKREELNQILVDAGVENPSKALVSTLLGAFNDEKRNAIVEASNKALEDYEGYLSPDEADKLKKQIAELEEKNNSMADYEDLKKYKSDSEAKLVSDKRIAYLKKLGFEKGADLVESKVDWSKAKYDEDKQEFTGLDVDSLKKNYDYLLVNKDNNQNKNIKFDNFGDSGKAGNEAPKTMREAVEQYYNQQNAKE